MTLAVPTSKTACVSAAKMTSVTRLHNDRTVRRVGSESKNSHRRHQIGSRFNLTSRKITPLPCRSVQALAVYSDDTLMHLLGNGTWTTCELGRLLLAAPTTIGLYTRHSLDEQEPHCSWKTGCRRYVRPVALTAWFPPHVPCP